MSASLVGSEMCIRDSPQHSPPAPGRSPRGEQVDGRWGGDQGTSGRCNCCLLYTSDAADDM
eukprot:12603173-Alexandrium_andersonii.AAC.1